LAFFLPDGKRFLYFMNWAGPSGGERNGLYAASLDSGTAKLLSSDITGNVFFAAGNLIYVRDRTIKAQPFDSSRLQIFASSAYTPASESSAAFGFVGVPLTCFAFAAKSYSIRLPVASAGPRSGYETRR
jgi:hypothetical protein